MSNTMKTLAVPRCRPQPWSAHATTASAASKENATGVRLPVQKMIAQQAPHTCAATSVTDYQGNA